MLNLIVEYCKENWILGSFIMWCIFKIAEIAYYIFVNDDYFKHIENDADDYCQTLILKIILYCLSWIGIIIVIVLMIICLIIVCTYYIWQVAKKLKKDLLLKEIINFLLIKIF